jgi:hypothetical protein
VKTCRHFRYQVPQDVADELRNADPEPCEICDALPRRRYSNQRPAVSTPVAAQAKTPSPVTSNAAVMPHGWPARLLNLLHLCHS